MRKIVTASGDVTMAPDLPPVMSEAEVLQVRRRGMICSRYQGREAIRRAGLMTAVEALIAAADADTQEAWAEVGNLERLSPMITGAAAQLGLTDAQLDNLLDTAMQIKV